MPNDRLPLVRGLRLRRRLPPFVDRAISFAVTAADGPETTRTKRLFTAVLWISLVSTGASFVQFVAQGAPLAAWTIVVLLTATIASLAAMAIRPGVYPGVMHFVVGVSIGVSVSLTFLFGGFLPSGANAMWGFVGVLGAIVIFEDRRAIAWLAVFAVSMVATLAMTGETEPRYELADPERQAVFNLILIMTFVFAVLYYYVRERSSLLARSEALLRNVLPDQVAERLKTSSGMIADDYEAASVLFADVAGFTPMSAGMSPKDLVTLLDEVFSAFDDLVEERGLEKIKTIGDAYMVAAGVPVPRDDHAHAICDLALAVQEHVEGRTFLGHRLRFRIGINSGPLVAGIIGRRKFSYDLWGDAVNTASRMESNGVVGRIQITEATHDLVRDAFVCQPAGTIEVKGKGPMRVWHLVGRRPADGSLPAWD